MAQQEVPAATWSDNLEQIVLRGLVWTFIGLLYAFIFLVITEYLRDVAPGVFPEIGAAVLARGWCASETRVDQ